MLDAVSGLGRLCLWRPLTAMWRARTAIRPFRFPKIRRWGTRSTVFPSLLLHSAWNDLRAAIPGSPRLRRR